MPYKFETTKTKIPEALDKRAKLTKEQREEIKELYGTISQRKLAKMFGVSRRLIIFIGDPEQHKENLKRRSERGGSMAYYDKEKNRKAILKHRRRKKKLYDKGLLIENRQAKDQAG